MLAARPLSLGTAVLSLLPGIAAAAGASAGVPALDEASFDGWLAEHPVALVEFYAPWCGHCKELAPIYAEAAEIIAADHGSQPLAKVDAALHTGLATRFNIESFPTLVLFRQGQPHDFEGTTDSSQAIVDAMTTQLDPNWKPAPDHVLALTADNFSSTLRKRGASPGSLTLVEFYAPWCGHCEKLAPVYRTVSTQHDGDSPNENDGFYAEQLMAPNRPRRATRYAHGTSCWQRSAPP